MAGIFKSIDQSDIRVTPFRSYKLWTDPEVVYGHVSNSLTDRPFNSLFEQQYNHTLNNQNTFYALSRPLLTFGVSYLYDSALYDTASYYLNLSDDDDRLFWIDGDGFTSLAQRSASYVFGEMDTNLDKIIAFTSNSTDNSVYLLNHDLTTYSSRSLSYLSPVVAYDACYYSPSNYKFIGMYAVTGSFGGLYEYETDTDFTAPEAVGDYWGVDFGSDNNIYTLFKSASTNDLYLASYDPGSPNFVYSAPFYVRSAPSGCKSFFVYQQDTYSTGGSIWMVFSDDTLYLSDCGDISISTLAMTDVVAVLVDGRYDVPSTSTLQNQRVHIITKYGLIYLDAHYDYSTQTLLVGKELRVEPYVGIGLGNYICKASITRNNESLDNGDTLITILAGNTGSLSETVLFTINTNTYEISDPIPMGSGKATMHILAYDEDKTYATDGRASINVGTGTFLNNWYTFNH